MNRILIFFILCAFTSSVWAKELPEALQSLRESVPQIAEVETYATDPKPFVNPTLFGWMTSDTPQAGMELPAWRALQQFYAVALVWGKAYDEALTLFGKIPTTESATPESLLFFRAVAEHQLLQKDACLKSLEELAPLAEKLPRRYTILANLMKVDMEAMKDGQLDHISRQMKDARRRMDGGDTGEKAQESEKKVVELLDKLIEKIEEQERQRQKMMMQAQSPSQSSKPAQDAKIMGGNGPGKVDKKNLSTDQPWGNLPPKEREESLQQIGHDFPPHYRDAIEQYFKRMADQ